MSNETETTALMPFIPAASELPAHLKNSGGLGNENVSQDDMAMPRLNILQQLSPQLDDGKAEYLESAKAGLFHNSVTNELYESVYVINLYYMKNYAIFKNRKFGKGFYGTYNTREDAMAYIQEQGLDINQLDITETGNHYCLLLDEEGNPKSPVIISLSSTKLKVSNKWNSDIRLQGQDRFAGVWELSTVRQSNDQGSWYNLKVTSAGWAPEELYNEAKETYMSVTSSLQPEAEAA